jgi:hypothetical protein
MRCGASDMGRLWKALWFLQRGIECDASSRAHRHRPLPWPQSLLLDQYLMLPGRPASLPSSGLGQLARKEISDVIYLDSRFGRGRDRA